MNLFIEFSLKPLPIFVSISIHYIDSGCVWNRYNKCKTHKNVKLQVHTSENILMLIVKDNVVKGLR